MEGMLGELGGGGGGGGDQVNWCDHLQVMFCLCIFVVLVFVLGRYCVMCVCSVLGDAESYLSCILIVVVCCLTY